MRVNGSKENQSDNEQIKFDNYYNLLFGRKKIHDSLENAQSLERPQK